MPRFPIDLGIRENDRTTRFVMMENRVLQASLNSPRICASDKFLGDPPNIELPGECRADGRASGRQPVGDLPER